MRWTRARNCLKRHTKVFAMRDFLLAQPAVQEWCNGVTNSVTDAVTPFVTRALRDITVVALLEVWATAALIGKSDGIDRVLTPATLLTLDEIGELPCLGAAMASVGWAVEEIGTRSVRLPNFMEHNSPEQEKQPPMTNAERQRRYRDNKKALAALGTTAPEPKDSVTERNESNAEVTKVTLEKRREEKSNNNTPQPPSSGGNGVVVVQEPGEKKEQPPVRRRCASDHPEHGAAAQRLVKLYREEVSSTWPDGGAVPVVMDRLADGLSEEQLATAVRGFAQHCRANVPERNKRQSAPKFFDVRGQHAAFLDWKPPPPPPRPPPLPPRHPSILGSSVPKKE